MATHKYKFFGPKDSAIGGTIGTTVTSTFAAPLVVRTSSIGNDALYLVDLDAELATAGWIRDDNLPDPPVTVTVLQEVESKLDADASAISTTSWTDVRSCVVTTDGDSRLKIVASCQAGVALGGGMRVLINGGSFSNQVLASSDYPVLSGNAPGHVTTYVDLPSGSQTYTVRMQASAVTLGSVTPRAGSALIVTERA